MSRRRSSSVVIVLPLLLVSLVVHELAHGWVATPARRPDGARPGPALAEPAAAARPVGTGVLVVTFLGSGGSFFFGWARPVAHLAVALPATRSAA